MTEDEEVSRPKRVEKAPLDRLSIADLQDYIGELHAEIVRAEAAIAHKRGARGLADSVFKT